jgi:hypothetical protein
VPCAPPVVVAPWPAVEAAWSYLLDVQSNTGSIYWVDQMNGVFRAPKSGGTFTLVPGTVGVQRTGLAVDDDGLYFCTPASSLVRAATDGSDPVTLSTGGLGCIGVAVDGADVYVATDQGLTRMDKTTGAGPTQIADAAATTAAAMWQLSAGASGVWWIAMPSGNTDTNGLLVVPEGGGPVVPIVPGGFSVTLAIGGGYAYYGYDWPNATAGTYRTSAPGAAPASLGAPYPVLAADADAYYSVLSLGVVRVSTAGGAPILLPGSEGADNQYLEVDETCVYWLDDTTETVMKAWKGAP